MFLNVVLSNINIISLETDKRIYCIELYFFRGECNGRTGTFPASFVRIVDSFPGDIPPKGADLRSYIKAQSGIFNDNLTSNGDRRNHNDYMNTQNAFPNLTESLKALEPTFTGNYQPLNYNYIGKSIFL